MSKYFVDELGHYLGGFDGAEPPHGSIEVPNPPNHANDKWLNGAWVKQFTLKDYDIAIEQHLDKVADEAGYYDPLGRIPNIDRACAYASFLNPYQAESQGFVAWRAEVWKKAYEIQKAVENGQRVPPSIPELIAELPVK